MNDAHEVISAFLDDEPFDPIELARALDDRAGRDLLIDLVALRHLVRAEAIETPAAIERPPRRPALRALVAVAVLVALVGGYFAGQRRSEAIRSQAPPATRVVQAPAWRDVPSGSLP